MNTFTYCALEYNNGVIGVGFEDKNVCDISFDSYNTDTVGSIYVAKVSEIVKNIDSAFILYAPGKKGYLSLKNIENPILLNREYDGRLKAGDELLVLLETEPIRTKDPVFTTNLSLSGKLSVVSSGNLQRTISSKINKSYKEELINTIPETVEYGVIIRTNALDYLKGNRLEDISKEITLLSDRLSSIINEGKHRTLYTKLYSAPGSVLTALRDNIYNYEKIVTDNKDIYNDLKDFLDIFMPESLSKLSFYENDSLSLSKLYSIETKVSELLEKKVWLKSGAYLIIEQTEAMYVIDVNSGKNISKKANSEYVYNINLEAAREIMRQIRLRNMSGMILVDFINMSSKELEDRLFLELSNMSKQDSVKTVIVDYTKLGLLEITRKKVKKSLNCQMQA